MISLLRIVIKSILLFSLSSFHHGINAFHLLKSPNPIRPLPRSCRCGYDTAGSCCGYGFAIPSSSSSSKNKTPKSTTLSILYSSINDNKNQNDENETMKTKSNNSPIAIASWYATEAFGKLFKPQQKQQQQSISSSLSDFYSQSPKSLKETLERIQLDNERSYFLSGEVDEMVYDDNCIFADPFVSFSGKDRFIENLANLGSFITKFNARPLQYDVKDNGTTVQTRIMVKLQLNLPWKPILAWPWGVTYTIDPNTFLITSHVESWDIEPIEGVKQIFRSPKSTF